MPVEITCGLGMVWALIRFEFLQPRKRQLAAWLRASFGGNLTLAYK